MTASSRWGAWPSNKESGGARQSAAARFCQASRSNRFGLLASGCFLQWNSRVLFHRGSLNVRLLLLTTSGGLRPRLDQRRDLRELPDRPDPAPCGVGGRREAHESRHPAVHPLAPVLTHKAIADDRFEGSGLLANIGGGCVLSGKLADHCPQKLAVAQQPKQRIVG